MRIFYIVKGFQDNSIHKEMKNYDYKDCILTDKKDNI